MSLLHEMMYKVGVRFRNPSLPQHYQLLKESERWDLAKLQQYQQRELLKFLEYAGVASEYYKNVFKSAGWCPGDPFTMDLFRNLPVIGKDVLIDHNRDIHSKERFSKTFACETSGTSGQVLTFMRNESWDSFNRASVMRGYSWYDLQPWEYSLYFWGYNFDNRKKWKSRLMDFSVNRHRIFSYSRKAVDDMIAKLPKAALIQGYSSMIYELALAAGDQKPDFPKLKLVKGTSEKIFPHYHDQTLKVFGKKIVSEYGAAETGIIAFECPQGNMHVNMEGVYLEQDPNGELIVTNFRSHSFPVIRYRLGDIVTMKSGNEQCACGMWHPVIEEITGRTGKTVYGFSGKYPSLVFYNIFKNLYFGNNLHVNYQAIQDRKGEISIRIKERPDTESERLILSECRKYFGDDMNVLILPGSDLRTNDGKLVDFLSNIEV